MLEISNTINQNVNINQYQFDYQLAISIAAAIDSINLDICTEEVYVSCHHRHRNPQTPALLHKLQQALLPCRHQAWLQARGIDVTEAYSLNYDILNLQDLLDLYVFPNDHILDKYGEKPIEGPAFIDTRNGQLAGICIRNITSDQNYAAAEKFTFSNYGWYLYGYDLYKPHDEIYLVEGVFDAIAMRKNGYNAIGLGTAHPTGIQLACLLHKYHNLKLCLDNDFWGNVGAYIVSNVLKIPIYQTELKDPGSYHHQPIQLHQIPLWKLGQRLRQEIPIYNRTAKHARPLPYNQEKPYALDNHLP